MISMSRKYGNRKISRAQVKNYFDFRVAAVIPSRDVEEFLKSNKIDFGDLNGKRKIRKCPMRKSAGTANNE